MSTWIKLNDNFATDLKVLAAGEDAAWLYVCGLLFCSANLTDGVIPTAALRTLTAKKDAKTLARVLVREGLWEETATGWMVHDYLKHQSSRAQVEAQREKARKRARARRVSEKFARTTTELFVPEVETDTETDNPTPTPPPKNGVTHGIVIDTDRYPVGLVIDPAQVETLRAVKSQVFGHTQQQEPPHA